MAERGGSITAFFIPCLLEGDDQQTHQPVRLAPFLDGHVITFSTTGQRESEFFLPLTLNNPFHGPCTTLCLQATWANHGLKATFFSRLPRNRDLITPWALTLRGQIHNWTIQQPHPKIENLLQQSMLGSADFDEAALAGLCRYFQTEFKNDKH